jgi:hypothetical protein
MRGNAIRAQRFQDAQQVQADSWVVAAPVGGLNARDALANMPETDAILLDNWFPQPTWIEIRNGQVPLAVFTGNAQTVAAYNALNGNNQLFAGIVNGAVNGVYRVDNAGGGSPGAAVVGGSGNTIEALTTVAFDWTQFGTGAAEILYMLNGTESPLLYDGTTWRAITSTSSPYAMTGGPSGTNAQLSQVTRYKSRLWFVQAGTFNVYYLPQNVFAGALTQLNLGPNFNLGGSLAMIATNSVDNAAGINDYIAFVSTLGEVVMFQGYDPAQVSTFSEAGHFRIGRPLALGRRGWAKVGSDAAVICVDGLIPLSKALVTDRSQPVVAISDKIRKALNDDAKTYGTVFGWQVVLYPMGTKLLINTPTQVNTGGYQYVQNTISGAWCTFGKLNSSWNAICFETMGDNLYYGAAGVVAQCDTGQSDNGMAILATAKPAFSYMNDRAHRKLFTQCQPVFQTSGKVVVSIILNVDFDTTAPTNTVPVSSGNAAVWNTSLWNVTYWGDAEQISQPWVGLNAEGNCASMQMRISANLISVKWQSTNYLFKPGGLFYGR